MKILKNWDIIKIGITIFSVSIIFSSVLFNNNVNGQTGPSVSQGVKIIAFGDSLVVGVGSTSGNDFVSLLSRRIGLNIISAGTSGMNTSQALSSVDSQVIAQDPDIVIVVLGGNDVLQNVPTATMISNLRTIVQRIQASGAKVILVGVHGSIFSTTREQAFANLASELSVGYVPNILSGILGNSRLLSDPVHPNDAGYQLMADRIFPALQTTINTLPNQTLSVTCSANRTEINTNRSLNWTAYATGGSGSYIYSWSGTEELQGATSMITKSYSSPGQKTASVVVRSGDASVTKTCDGTVNVTEPVLSGSCNVSATPTPAGYRIVFSSNVHNAVSTSTSYNWSGDENIIGNSQSVTKDYSTPGQKNATVIIRSGNQTLSLTCGASIDPIAIATTTNYWNYSCNSTVNDRVVTWGTTNIYNSPLTWSGTEGLAASSSSVQKTYTSDGIKTANVNVRGNGENHNVTCQTAVSNSSNIINNENGRCFIATAAFGTPFDSNVITLRNFRDEQLLTNPFGREFVENYYKYSPTLAKYIENSESLKLMVRIILTPIVLALEIKS